MTRPVPVPASGDERGCLHAAAQSELRTLSTAHPEQALERLAALIEEHWPDPTCRPELRLMAADILLQVGALDRLQVQLDACSPQTAEQRVRHALLLGQADTRTGRLHEAERHFRVALGEAATAQLTAHQAAATSFLAQVRHRTGNSEEALGLIAQALLLRQQLGDVDGEIRALCNTALIFNAQARLPEAVEALTQAQLLLPRCAEPLESALHVSSGLGLVHETTHQYEEAYEQFMRAKDVAARAGNQAAECLMTLNSGEMARQCGKFIEAGVLLGDALHVARALSNTQVLTAALQSLGLLYAETGHPEAADRAFADAAALSEHSSDIDTQLELLQVTAEQYLGSPAPQRAAPLLHRALTLSEQAVRPAQALTIHNLLARLYEGDDPRRAIRHLKQAAALSNTLRDVALSQQARDLTREAELHSTRREIQYERDLRRTADAARTEALTALENGKLSDDLTGLPNRVMLHALLTNALSTGGPYDGDLSLLVVDLDRFKQFNDALGSAGGDQVLREVASRFKESLKPHDILARAGSNEFLMVLFGQTPKDREAQADALLRGLQRNFSVMGQDLYVSASAGLAHHPEHGLEAEDLHRAAHIALDDARRDGRRLRVYSGGDQLRVQAVALDAALSRALELGEFELHFQPLIDAHSRLPVCAEALVRWNSATLGRKSPAEFIPALERSGGIIALGAWVLKEACKRAATWNGVRVAVNLSARQFQEGDLMADVLQALALSGLPPERLELEITESMLIQSPERVTHLLTALNTLGVRVMLDDFGTGYSSLSILRTLAVSGIKLDRSFVAALERGGNLKAQAIIRSVVGLSQALDLDVVAEGVEHADEGAVLRHLGVNLLQGYHYARPSADWTPVGWTSPD
ncbi:EAL domain-containing protein [Deinococcus sp. QL22]|uniref:EAL domain-containing protein n=1 Tax=Deinococcus sp. QL22 TaxID=2939437 RepID=UPI002016B686|nr:EAL domain-containing protein [Deinococcus sp. QL22]UQN08636.1 EAL domain-containing protein [Deinococcus sp. QL22]